MTRYTADIETVVTANDQDVAYPQSVTELENGYVVVWYGGNFVNGTWLEGDLYAQRFDNSGNKVGSTILVNTTTADDQYGGNTTALDDGGFIVTWVSATVEDEMNYTLNGVVTAQRFDANGNKVGGETEFGSCDANSPPFVVALDSGGVNFYWTNYSDGVAQTYVQSLDNNGDPVGGPQIVQSGMQLNSITNIGGNIIATFSNGDVYVRNLGASGTGGSASLVNTGFISNDQILSHVAETGNGKYVVIWTSLGQDGNGYGIFQQLYNADGTPSGGQTQVNTTTTGNQYYSQVTALADGQYVVVYSSPDGSGPGVFAQIFDADGQKVGTEFMINTTTTGNQTLPEVVAGDDGSFAVYWSGVDSSNNGQIYQRDYHAGLTLDGTSSVDTLTGGAYADELNGLNGNDTLNGLADDDYLNGGAGADTMNGGLGNDTYIVDNAGDATIELNGQGTDTILASVSYTIGASTYVENLTLTGTANISATGNSLANTLIGNSGSNTLNGGSGADTMSGGAGNDVYIVDNTGDMVTELPSEGTDRVNSSISYTIGANVENLTLTGSGNINGSGNALDNTLVGNSGNNTLNGSTGADIMNGGAGNDTYLVDNAGDVIVEGSSGGTDAIFTSITYSINGTYIENLTLLGGESINASGNNYDNILVGNAGDNTLNGSQGADTMNGGAGNDTYIIDNAGDVVIEGSTGGTDNIYTSITYSINGTYIENLYLTGSDNINGSGNNYDNLIVGNSGNNTINGSVGADTMNGGAGNDTYIVDNAADVVIEGNNSGTDTIYASINYSLGGRYVENLFLTGTADINATGNAGDNTLVGNSGNNVFNGGAGADTMNGGSGNDTYYVDNAGDTIIEGNGGGSDNVISSITYSLAGSYVEDLTLTGSTNINATGNNLANTLTGNAGGNTFNGGAGNDILTGGGGNDIFWFGAGSGTDTITDFSDDTLNLNAYSHGVANGGGIVIAQVGSDTTIDLGGGNIITLTGIAPADLTGHIVW